MDAGPAAFALRCYREFAAAVTGFERQPAFVDAARPLLPGFTSHQVDSLSRLPAADRSFDVVLTFTVLQHLTDRAVSEAAAEVRRIVRPGGLVLLCEDTNPAARFGDVEKGRGLCVIGRPVETYAALLTPLRLLTVAPRRVEPTYPSPDVGHFMLFRA